MSYTLEKISSLIGAHLVGKEDVAVSWLLTDSRSLCFPEDTLFFALESRRNDGHKYISELYRRGYARLLSVSFRIWQPFRMPISCRFSIR